VAKGRKLAVGDAEGLARGRIWTGAQAKERGLVDELGGLSRALALAKEKASLPTDAAVVTYPKEQDFWEALVEGDFSFGVYAATLFGVFGQSDMERLVHQMESDFSTPSMQAAMPDVSIH
jgi:protease IV